MLVAAGWAVAIAAPALSEDQRRTLDRGEVLFLEEKSAGYRIGPFEVESAILKHPDVAEAAVVGVPDSLRGHVVKAYVVLKPGHQAYPGIESDIADAVKRHAGAHQYPRVVELVSALPKTETGKIQRYMLRRR